MPSKNKRTTPEALPEQGILHLRVKAGARKEGMLHPVAGEWIVCVRARALDGKANEAVIQLLSAVLQVPKSRIMIQKGHTIPHKKILISGLNTLEIESRLIRHQGS